jgi:3-oxoacyl-[acyl-carrier protein] reductase
MNGRLVGKVGIVAGAGGGMGRAVPLRFAAEGARVLLVARRPEPLAALAGEIEARGGEAAWVTADLTTAEGAACMAAAALERWGQIDILYDNLGDSAHGGRRLHETDEAAWEYLIDINLRTAPLCARAVLPAMLERRRGVILLVSAAAATRLRANAGYAAAKGGLLELTRSLARQYRPDGVRVNCLCPGSIGGSRGEEDAELPPPELTRSGHPADVSWAAVYLASDEAAWITGVCLPVDGGASLL